MQRYPGLLLYPHTPMTPRRALEEGSEEDNWEVEELDSRLGDHEFLEPNPVLPTNSYLGQVVNSYISIFSSIVSLALLYQKANTEVDITAPLLPVCHFRAGLQPPHPRRGGRAGRINNAKLGWVGRGGIRESRQGGGTRECL